MENKNKLAPPKEPIRFQKPLGRASRRFLSFLICSAILVAAFAVSGVWMKRASGDFWDGWGSFFGDGGANEKEAGELPNEDATQAPPTDTEAPSSPESLTSSIVTMDLSYLDYGMSYLCNETGYRPDVESLRASPLGSSRSFDPAEGPVVLVLHTHASEAYWDANATTEEGSLGDAWYSDDPSRSVVAVGSALCQSLNENGIPAIHCAEMHGEEGTLRNSYALSAECIRKYLERYPSIEYVIDVHRDGILSKDGKTVRTLVSGSEEPTAQVMAVVGTDGNGDAHPMWSRNLLLALRLRDGLESAAQALSRPVFLRNATYNQELVPCALLLEIGSSGNTVEEAIRAAKIVGKTLADLILSGA